MKISKKNVIIVDLEITSEDDFEEDDRIKEDY